MVFLDWEVLFLSSIWIWKGLLCDWKYIVSSTWRGPREKKQFKVLFHQNAYYRDSRIVFWPNSARHVSWNRYTAVAGEAAVRITARPPRLTRPPISLLNIVVFGLRRYQTTQVSGPRRYRDLRLAARNYTQPQMVLLSGVVCACAIEGDGRCPVFGFRSRIAKTLPIRIRNSCSIFQIF